MKANLSKSKVFSKLDANSGFWQLAYQPQFCMFDNEQNKYVDLTSKVNIKYLYVQNSRLEMQKCLLSQLGVKLWNEIPSEVKWSEQHNMSSIRTSVCFNHLQSSRAKFRQNNSMVGLSVCSQRNSLCCPFTYYRAKRSILQQQNRSTTIQANWTFCWISLITGYVC